MKQIKQPQNIFRAAIYARVSSQKQKEEETIESQVKALHELAGQKGYEVPKILTFLDNGVSGSILQRPGLDELRDVIKTEPLEVLFIYSPDRLSRNYTYQLIILDELKKNGVKVFFLKSPSEADTPEAKMLTHFQGIFAEYERALILDRSRRGRFYKAKQNDPAILPSIPYGYQKIKEGQKITIHIVPEQALLIKEIFKMYVIEGLSLQKISDKLFERKIKTPRGYSRWNISTVRGILKNHAYIGVAYYGKTERCEGVTNRIRRYKSGKRLKALTARKNKPESEWISIDMPQLINENDFELAQKRLKENTIHAARNTREPGLLQGLLVCGECGLPFYKRSRKYSKGKVNLYFCCSHSKSRMKKCDSKSINQHELDQLVYDEVLKLLKNPSLIQDELARRSKEYSNTEEMERREITIKKELCKLSVEHDRLLDAYQSGLLNLNDLGKRNRSLDTRRNELEKAAQAIQAMKFERVGKANLQDNFEAILKRMEAAAEDLSLVDKQKLIRLLVESVVVKNGEIKIVHCISPKMIASENGQLSFDSVG